MSDEQRTVITPDDLDIPGGVTVLPGQQMIVANTRNHPIQLTRLKWKTLAEVRAEECREDCANAE